MCIEAPGAQRRCQWIRTAVRGHYFCADRLELAEGTLGNSPFLRLLVLPVLGNVQHDAACLGRHLVQLHAPERETEGVTLVYVHARAGQHLTAGNLANGI